MVSYYCLNLILQVVLILFNIPDITCKRKTSSQHYDNQRSSSSYQYYSRGTGVWKTMNYLGLDEILGSEKSLKFSTPKECARPCKADSPPKTCYYHWTLELYHTLGGACDLCSPTTNTSISSDCQCIKADGKDKSGMIVANRQVPGPPINVCIGDMVVVDVVNKLAGRAVTIHWHGIFQMDFQYYDGVPHVTQCPQPAETEFRYQWRAQNSGTHWWHGHAGFDDTDGLSGAIVIRMPRDMELSRKLYNHDGYDHHMFIQDWQHDNMPEHIPGTVYRNVGQSPDTFLINGHGQWLDPKTKKYTNAPLAEFNVVKGQRYRIRMINGCNLVCPIELRIQQHRATICSMDGSDVHPHTVDTITSLSAERYDFILDANQPVGTYWIEVRGIGACESRKIQQYAILRYRGSKHKEPDCDRPSYENGLPRGVVFNAINEVCDGSNSKVVCAKDLKSAEPLPKGLYDAKPDMQIFLPFGFEVYDKEELYGSHKYPRFVDAVSKLSLAALVGGISYSHSPSPLISQYKDIPRDDICIHSEKLPARCKDEQVCHCTHIVNIKLGSMVEIILQDSGAMGISHPFHLHGYAFHVMGAGLSREHNITSSNKGNALTRHREVYPPKNNRPPAKDTFAIPSGGYAILRFMADNPGWWLLHCHFIAHYYNGMTVVLHVGEDSDLPPIPEHFPKCGNFRPKVHKSNPKPKGALTELTGVQLPVVSSVTSAIL